MPSKAMTQDEQIAYLLSFYDEFERWLGEKRARLEALSPVDLALAKCAFSSFRPFINHVVKMKTPPGSTPRETFERRARKAVEVGLNAFYMPADFLEVDFLSDSGSSAMTTSQWAALVDGDESYGSNEGWMLFNEAIAETFGPRFGSVFLGLNKDSKLNEQYKHRKNFNYLTNQGRGAENCLFPALAQCLIKRDTEHIKGKDNITYLILCSNNFFDTTSGHILNIQNREIFDLNGERHHVTFDLRNFPNGKVRTGTYSATDKYLGNGNFEALTATIEDAAKETNGVAYRRVGVVFTVVTNNSGGSQPVSMDHIKSVANLCKKHGIPYFLDACRFAENAYMIKQLEKDAPLGRKSIPEIVHEMFECVDGFTISLKKDGIANCGGAICFAPTSTALAPLVDQPKFCMLQTIYDSIVLQVGHITYGSLTGRDIKAICQGLKTVVREEYLQGRVSQVHEFASVLRGLGVPILEPTGTSAIYIDMDKFMDDTDQQKKKRGSFYGNSFVGLCLCAGIRTCELGASAFSSPHGNAPYKTPEDVSGNFVRLAIPRQLYSDADLYRAALWIAFLYESRAKIKPVQDREGLRSLSLHHFKMMFDYTNK
ncbi:Tryptophanase [Giardia muris]|uniref:Tryptophanase n=1 Tax=Giardia muris TaxID=5742 RepID=A0A4Z1SN47_GIAMU|nr:Tryptophanase [Giardia muris]|eukprot:TNJ27136.1 Tryptophanase [Giardia muris]